MYRRYLHSWPSIFFLCAVLSSGASILASEGLVTSRIERIRRDLPKAYRELGPAGTEALIQILEHEERTTDAPTIVQGRLTLTSGTPVTTSDVTAATTVYFTPYNGNKIALYSGSNWQLLNFTEKSVAVPSNTSTPFDIFAYNNSGTVALEALAWTDGTNRATALTTQDGVQVKSGATTRRYLGTGRTTGVSGQTEDSAAKRFLWNFYNRVPRPLFIKETGATWLYSALSWRPINNNSATQVQIVVGLVGARLSLTTHSVYDSGSGKNITFGIGEDQSGAVHSQSVGIYGGYNLAATQVFMTASTSLKIYPAIGYHYYQMIEKAHAGGTAMIYGPGSGEAFGAGISGEFEG